MKGILLFVLGFIAGVIFTFFILFLFSLGTRNNEINNTTQVQYIDIKGKKGNIQVHTGMPKDSVRIIAGKPDDVDLMSIGNSTHETWGYKIRDKYYPDLKIEFEDGQLTGVRQN
jgi:hypothetical protein